jgi:hypothetical protein
MTIKKHLFALMLLLNGCVEELKMVKGGVIGAGAAAGTGAGATYTGAGAGAGAGGGGAGGE